MATSNETCSNCGKLEGDGVELKTCSICRTAKYCGADCQKAAWSTHKAACNKSATEQLITAVRSDDAETVTRLAKTKRVLNGRVDFTSMNDRGEENTLDKWTALHECVRSDKTEILKLLLENGAKVDITDVDGETPLFVASTSRNAETVQVLLDAGANPNFRARDGWSCLMMAARDGDYNVTKALLEGGADLRAGQDMFGRNALDIVGHMRTGQGIRRSRGETYEEAMEKYMRLYELLSEHAARY